MAFEKEARTAFAHKALELSELFMIKFGARAFSGEPRRGLHVQPPEESTGGGKLAREPIALVPVGGAQGTSLVVGWMDVGENVAELRSWRVLDAVYQQRFGGKIDLPQSEYDAFLNDARSFFAEESIPVRLVEDIPAAPRSRADPSMATSGSSEGMSVAVLILVALAMAVVGVAVGWLLFAPK
jgi:hypothetical protein